jgi:hypothetical protein
MNTKPEKLGYSAHVRIELNVNGFTLSVGQLGPDFIILREPTDHPPAEAEIALWIDGAESRWPVKLPEGLSKEKARTKITRYR